MAEIKTKATNQKAKDFIKTIEPELKRTDSLKLLELFTKVTGEKPAMWGTSIVGFGKYHYKSERSTQEGDWPLVAFSPRKQNLTLYVVYKDKKIDLLLSKLGKHKISGSCLYINKLSDIKLDILGDIVKESFVYKKKVTNN